jgi:hypothetical protein
MRSTQEHRSVPVAACTQLYIISMHVPNRDIELAALCSNVLAGKAAAAGTKLSFLHRVINGLSIGGVGVRWERHGVYVW